MNAFREGELERDENNVQKIHVNGYLSHFMRSRNYHQQIRMGVVDGKICSISAKELGRALIAVPSLQEQQRIVSILDNFEASIQNLEAQLSQREKQYEYYRNKLLTFE